MIKKLITKSTLSRLFSYINLYDCAIISSHREGNDSDIKFIRSNQSSYISRGFGVSVVKRSYFEDYNAGLAKEINENSFFIVNLQNDPEFKYKICFGAEVRNLGNVIYIVKEGANVIVMNTSKKNAGSGNYDEVLNLGSFRPKREGEFAFQSKPGKEEDEAEDLLERSVTYSSLMRLFSYIHLHECAIIPPCKEGNDPNLNLVGKLASYLRMKGYGYALITGSYIEDYNTGLAGMTQKNSFFIVNLANYPGFKETICKLGECFDQDVIVYIEKEGRNTFFIGTNKEINEGRDYGVMVNAGAFLPKTEPPLIKVKGDKSRFVKVDKNGNEVVNLLHTINEGNSLSRWGWSTGSKEVEKLLKSKNIEIG